MKLSRICTANEALAARRLLPDACGIGLEFGIHRTKRSERN